MPKTREQKRVILEDLADKVSRAKSVVFTKFEKLKVSESEDLRRRLKAEGSECFVAKKTLISMSFKKNHPDIDLSGLDGKVAAVFGFNDEVAPAKVVNEFKKSLEEEKIFFLGGILENKFISSSDVQNLANLPSKKELYSKMVGSLNAPISGFVNVLAGNLRGLVCVLKAVSEKKS